MYTVCMLLSTQQLSMFWAPSGRSFHVFKLHTEMCTYVNTQDQQQKVTKNLHCK